MSDKTIILDRDGVINHDSDAYIKSPAEWRPVPGSAKAIARLNRAGYRVVVISNQSGIARGFFSHATLEAINQKMRNTVAIAGGEIETIYFCPHVNEDHCDCRKPKPGLFFQAASELRFELENTTAIGDSIRDLVAARDAGASPILVETGKGPRSLAHIAALPSEHWLHSVPCYPDLATAVDALLI